LKEKIAIILSVYKNDKLTYLQEAIESLDNEDVDIFVQLDGAVTEEVEDYLDELLMRKSIFYLGKRRENKGLAYSLNELIQVALEYNFRYTVVPKGLPNAATIFLVYFPKVLNANKTGNSLRSSQGKGIYYGWHFL